MEVQYKYIVDLAKLYRSYAAQPELLFADINNLPPNILEDVYEEYGDPDNSIQPVNLLRAEVARQRLKGFQISEKLVDDIKEKIRTKDEGYFSYLTAKQASQFKDYEVSKRDMFANWQKPWSVFHTFFYGAKRSADKETIQLYLDQISNDLINALELKDYRAHWVDFQGASNFGSEWCWIAIYPISRDSHRDAYQFFVQLKGSPEAGRKAGFSISNPEADELRPANSYSEALRVLRDIKPELIKLNQKTRNYFKFAPGTQASQWPDFYRDGIAAISYRSGMVGDLTTIKSREDLNVADGKDPNDQSNKTWNMYLFRTANVGDVLFANKGKNEVVGIGVIQGEYYYDSKADDFKHRRKVTWITDKVYQNKGATIKNLFRPDTFSPTRVWNFILAEYLRLYPDLHQIFRQYNLASTLETTIASSGEGPTNEPESGYNQQLDAGAQINYWWLNANPKVWSINSHQEGQLQFYTTHNEKGNKRRIYKHFQNVKEGDIVIGYESTPTKQIKAIYEITKEMHNASAGEQIEFELVEKLDIPVHWNDLKNNPALENCEPFINNQGSLFKLSEAEFDIVREVIDNKNIASQQVQGEALKKYKFQNDNDKPFIGASEFTQIVLLLVRKKNIILQGPPGVGKTFLARKIAYEIMGEERDSNIEMVQFHQSYSYEDFIQGIRPNTKGGFDVKEGVFYSFCQRAIAHPDRKFFFIIDEINRGNLSKIFGELLMLIEADKRIPKVALKLTYAEDEDDRFYVPENLFIIGTMNTADRSLAIIDYALRRRFAFVNLRPDFGDNFVSFLRRVNLSQELIDHIRSNVGKVNRKIKDDPNLGEGYQIGHSYFCAFNNNGSESDWWRDIVNFEIKPMLEEIWFDDKITADEMLKLLDR